MERLPISGEGRKFFNVFYASSIADIINSAEEVARSKERAFIDPYSKAIETIENFRVTLFKLSSDISSSLMIAVSKLRHFPEMDDPKEKNRLKLIDSTGELQVEIPLGIMCLLFKYLPKDHRDTSWCKDVLIYAKYSRSGPQYRLVHIFQPDEPNAGSLKLFKLQSKPQKA